jgi:predicted O-methyltransferase YrrM
MRTFKHWTIRYIADRLALAYHEYSNPTAPWLTRSMVEILDGWIRKGDVGVEFGSGRSTVWFGARVANLISVEHDDKWAAHVGEMIRRNGMQSKITYVLANRENIEDSYLSVFSKLRDSSIDFFLVDGICRDQCAVKAIEKLKPGGIVILDNANWYLVPPAYSRSPSSLRLDSDVQSGMWSKFSDLVSNWRFVWTSNGVTDTAFWIKPFQ